MIAKIFKFNDYNKEQSQEPSTPRGTGNNLEREKDYNDFLQAKDAIQSRRVIRRLYCHIVTRWCRSKRDRMLLKIGEERSSNSMDVITFIRNQLFLLQAVKSMLTPQERFLVVRFFDQ